VFKLKGQVMPKDLTAKLMAEHTPSITLTLTPNEASTLRRLLTEAMSEHRVSPTDARSVALGIIDSLKKGLNK
jgi:hypothetical protein